MASVHVRVSRDWKPAAVLHLHQQWWHDDFGGGSLDGFEIHAYSNKECFNVAKYEVQQ